MKRLNSVTQTTDVLCAQPTSRQHLRSAASFVISSEHLCVVGQSLSPAR